MDNVDKHEDFLSRMQGLLDNAKKQGHIIVRVEDLENTFPELKENKDEKIRKAIYNTIKYLETEHSWDFLDDVDILDVYAWLEKQGKKPQGKSAFESINEEKVNNQNCVKPTDKVEVLGEKIKERIKNM